MTDKNKEALAALDMIKYHHNQVSEPAFNGYIETIRAALQPKPDEDDDASQDI